jgi:hypothetical protein
VRREEQNEEVADRKKRQEGVRRGRRELEEAGGS